MNIPDITVSRPYNPATDDEWVEALREAAAPEITVYGKTGPCGMCDATYRKLDKLRLPYISAKLEDHPDMVEECKNLGMLEAPIVVVRYADGSTERWSGYRPDRLGKLGRQFTATS